MFDPNTFAFNTEDVTVYLAAAGAGKTTALINKMAELLAVYRPDEIAFITYTRKGVANGIERALQTVPGLTAEDLPYFKTLHALCFRELGLTRASILTRKRMKRFSEGMGFHIYLRGPTEQQTDDDRLLARYDAERSGAPLRVLLRAPYDQFRYARLVNAYEAYKKAGNFVDFHDCLSRFKEAGQPVGVKAAFIDEAQDLTALQWEVCRTAFANCEKIFIAGDDFQAIFSHSGSLPQVLISFSARYPTVRLERSYRLPKAVYNFTKGIVKMLYVKADKDFAPAKGLDGFVRDIWDRDDLYMRILRDIRGNGFLPGRWYLLFRNNLFIAQVTGELEKYAIPYHTSKGFCIEKRDFARIKRYYNYRKLGHGSKEAFENFCREYRIQDINDEFTESALIPSKRKYVYMNYIDRYGLNALEEMADQEPFLLASTTHRVKGGEADYTAVFMDCTRKVAGNRLYNLDEELRVLYVACTRSRIGLYLVRSSGMSYGLDKLLEAVKGLSA
jgi:superfamily I DNA/RNA helicase